MLEKKGGNAISSWFAVVRKAAAARRPFPGCPSRRTDRTPRGMETRTIIRKLITDRHSVTGSRGASRDETGI